MSILDLFKSKTVWGALLAIVGWLLQPEVLSVLPDAVAAILQAVGAFLAAIGLRVAVAKSGPTP